jgi:hypothetical protein
MAESWPPEDAVAITLRIGDTAGISYITPTSAHELVARLRALQTAMGSAQLVASELQRQIDTPPADRASLTLFGEQANTIVMAIDEWASVSEIPDDIEKLHTALVSEEPR